MEAGLYSITEDEGEEESMMGLVGWMDGLCDG